VAWGLGEEPPAREDGAAILAYLQTNAPPVYDPFCGGGSIPLEAQRLGLRAHGSDLNPVAVLISKALVEIPPKFAEGPPVHPGHDTHKRYRGAQGLAEDVRFYGQWMRDEAERRIGHLYPKALLPDGSEATVIAWLWARTVRSPDPRAKAAMVPLVSSFLLSTKEGKKTWVEPVIDPTAPDGWRFEVRTGALVKADEERLKQGTKTARGSFSCVLTGAAIPLSYIRTEAKSRGLNPRLMAVVAEGKRTRIYLSGSAEQELVAASAEPAWGPEELVTAPSHDVDRLPMYGMSRWRDAFTPRQLVALTTFSDLVGKARKRVLADAHTAALPDDPTLLHEGGAGAAAYADAVATYLAQAASKLTAYHNTVGVWRVKEQKTGRAFGRQAIAMVWDFPECNPFAGAGGDWDGACSESAAVLRGLGGLGKGSITSTNAQHPPRYFNGATVTTDPPYYDNVGYADLSDFFYVWLKRSLADVWPDLFRRLTTPKTEELVATPYRHGGKERPRPSSCRAWARLLRGCARWRSMGNRLPSITRSNSRKSPRTGLPRRDGLRSYKQWFSRASPLTARGLSEQNSTAALKSKNNTLASSIVLVCRKRAATAQTATRADFLRALKREMPEAVGKIRKASVGPVDMPQSVIGPGMGVFTRYARVLEDDDSAMSVKTALALINRVWGEIENDLDANFDPETQVALAWFATYGFEARASGDLIGMANAKNIPIEALFRSGVFQNLHGKAGLTPREKLPEERSPATDRTATVWECVQHTARVLRAEDGGAEPAARLLATMGARAEDARALAYRLYEIASQKGWAAEALVYNELAQDWTQLEDQAARNTPEIRDLFGAVAS
jgi:putative DNA methylase